MAINSKAKRMSVVAIGAMYIGPVIIPNGSIGRVDRSVLGYSYAGFAGDTTFVVFDIEQPADISRITQPADISRITQPLNVQRITQPANVSRIAQPADMSRYAAGVKRQ